MKNLILIFSILILTACDNGDHGTHYSPCTDAVTEAVGVGIGDSIMEGHPALHGRAHGQCENLPGQTPYYLEEQFNIRVLNQGIGGQTCGEILSRWEKDVEAYDVQFVWLSCGQNDLARESDPIASIKKHVSKALQKAQIGGYHLYIQNLGYDYRDRGNDAKIDEANAWLASLSGPGVTIVDYHSWALTHKSLIPDGIHPSKEGYESFALSVINQLN